MSRNLLPGKWMTERLKVEDSTLDEVQELQKINDAVPQTQSWMRVEGQDEAVTFHPKFQGKGYGPELMSGLIEIVKQLGSYTCMRSYASLTNWPSLRLCVKVGLNRMVEIVGDKVHSDKAEAHVLLEKSFTGLESC